MTILQTQVKNLKPNDFYIEEVSNLALEIRDIVPADTGEPIGIYYGKKLTIPKQGHNRIGVVKLLLQNGYYINLYEHEIVWASFYERDKSNSMQYLNAKEARNLAKAVPAKLLDNHKQDVMLRISTSVSYGGTSCLVMLPTQYEQELITWLRELNYNVQYVGILPRSDSDEYQNYGIVW